MKKTFFGFTLIETIVVVAVVGLTLPVLFAIIFTLIRQQVKIYRLSEIKRSGDYVINLMENTIRNRAVAIYNSPNTIEANIVCEDIVGIGTTNNLYFVDDNKNMFGYKLTAANKIASSSAFGDVVLTSTNTVVTNFSISCIRNSIFSPASIYLDFDVCYYTGSANCATNRPEEVSSMHYQTKIKLRNN